MRNALTISGYFFATATQSALAFFSVPLLVRGIGVAEFGRWSLIEPVAQLVAQCALLGLNQGAIRLISHDGLTPWAAVRLILRRIWPVLLLAGVGTAAATLAMDWLRPWAAWLLGLFVLLEAVLALFLSSLRAGNRVAAFASGIVIRSAAILALLSAAIFAGVPAIHSAENVLGWWGLVWLLAAGLLAILIVREKGPPGSAAQEALHFQNALRYGLPLLATVLFAFVTQYADRFLLSRFFNYEILGHYVIYLKIAAALNFLVLPVQLWWPSARFQWVKRADGGASLFPRAALAGSALFLAAALGVWAVSPWLIRWFAPGVAFDGDAIFLLALAVALNGMAVFVNVGLLLPGRTHLNIPVSLIAAVSQIGLVSWLAPLYGVVGAALATVLTALINLVLQAIFSQRCYPLPFRFGLMGALFVAVAMIAVATRGLVAGMALQ